jgi:hypothetical protein
MLPKAIGLRGGPSRLSTYRITLPSEKLAGLPDDPDQTIISEKVYRSSQYLQSSQRLDLTYLRRDVLKGKQYSRILFNSPSRGETEHTPTWDLCGICLRFLQVEQPPMLQMDWMTKRSCKRYSNVPVNSGECSWGSLFTDRKTYSFPSTPFNRAILFEIRLPISLQ